MVADAGHAVDGLAPLLAASAPADVTAAVADDVQRAAIQGAVGPALPAPAFVADASALAAQSFDDIVYFGADADRIEQLQGLLAPRGVLDLVLGGTRIGRAGGGRRRQDPLRPHALGRHDRARRPSTATRSHRPTASSGPATGSR